MITRTLTLLRLLLVVLLGAFAWNALAGLGVYDPAIYTASDAVAAARVAAGSDWQPTLLSGIAALAVLLVICFFERCAQANYQELSSRIRDLGGAFVDDSDKTSQQTLWQRCQSALFSAVPTIVSVDFSDAPVADKDLRFITQLTRLRSLDLSRTAISLDGLRFLTRLPGLEILSLAETQLGDEACEQLASCNSLRQLDLSKTSVTDNGLALLNRLKNLKTLTVAKTLITDAALEQFRYRQTSLTDRANPQGEVTMS